MKKFTSFMLGVLVIGALTGCSNNKKEATWEDINSTQGKVDFQLEHMTIEEKIGQMLIASYRSPVMDDTLKEALLSNKPGGFILFKENFSNYEDTLKLIDEIKATSEIPMFIAIDQEGGLVQRLKELGDKNATIIPPMLEVGKKQDPELAYQVGQVIAEELQAFGINMDFAPDVDVLDSMDNKIIGNRSFGTDPKTVSTLGNSLAKGLKDYGVIPVLKHFPGHGSASVDSHQNLPIIEKTKEELLKSDLIPFQDAIQDGIDIIMIGHLAVPSITEENVPASLSKSLITDLLKNEMGYTGLVVTDALNMGALTNHYTEKEIYEMAINAGVDLLLMPKSTKGAISSIKESLEEGTIKEEQINASVRKILTLKYEKLSTNVLSKEYIGSEKHQEILNSISK